MPAVDSGYTARTRRAHRRWSGAPGPEADALIGGNKSKTQKKQSKNKNKNKTQKRH